MKDSAEAPPPWGRVGERCARVALTQSVIEFVAEATDLGVFHGAGSGGEGVCGEAWREVA